MSEAKILFLDFDDVLNTSETLERGELFERANVEALNAIVDRTGAHIVVTSTWRVAATPEELEEILVQAGVHASGRVIGTTPFLEESSRGGEIMAWLEQAPVRVNNYVILDNRNDMEACVAQLVQTDPSCGLAFDQVDEVVHLLR